MRWIAKIEIPEPLKFVISHAQQVGFYVYVYKRDRMLYDYLQDTLEQAKEFALQKFQVPVNSWTSIDLPERWQAETLFPKPIQITIKNDLIMGYYLLVPGIYGKQDFWSTLEQAKNVALQKYQVPLSAWKVVD